LNSQEYIRGVSEVMKVTHVGNAAKDLEETVKFHTEISGLKEIRRLRSSEGMTLWGTKGRSFS